MAVEAFFIVVLMMLNSVDLSENKDIKIITDVDVGVDDAIAIFYILKAEKDAITANSTDGPKLMAITCVHGNTEVDQVVSNTIKVLELVDRSDIPVYKGADRSILKTPSNDEHFGVDGLGDLKTLEIAQKEHAVNALIRLVNENPGEITLMAMGPLTNIALAIRLDGQFLNKLNKLIILGGSVKGRGNIFPGIEYNFYKDPEANYIVLNDAHYGENSIMLMPWETVLSLEISMEWRKDILGRLESPLIKFLNEAEHIDDRTDDTWIMADPIIPAIFLNDTLITNVKSYPAQAITEGTMRGALVVDYDKLLQQKKKINIVYDMNREDYKNNLYYHLS